MTVATEPGIGTAALWRLLSLGFTAPTEETLAEMSVLAEALAELPDPAPELAQLVSELHAPFFGGRGGPGGWWILIEPDIFLGVNDIVSPDLVGWRRERVPAFPATRPITTVPDWIAEVLSPSNERRDRVHKADLYLTAGVPFYWIVDVGERTLEAYRSQQGAWMRLGAWTDGERVRRRRSRGRRDLRPSGGLHDDSHLPVAASTTVRARRTQHAGKLREDRPADRRTVRSNPR